MRLAVLTLFVAAIPALAADDPTRIFDAGSAPKDGRLNPAKTLNDYFPFTPPKSKEEWAKRRQQVREQLLFANGLWPLPEKTPLRETIHGQVAKDGYIIEKVSFASMPGHFVTGNLYRPTSGKKDERRPAVLFAHGHWANGRFHDAGPKAAEQSVKTKAEADLDRGRFFMQAIPVQLARMGFVVFQYDMVGYADSTAIPHREGFKDAQAELRLQSQMVLQTWNSIRALDFVSSLPDVDPKRIGMTGASGGGTQTFILAALDDRLAAAFPAVMVSTAMQGGCVCENCSYLRVGTGNVEMAGLFAPKPLALSAADDWTKEFLTKGFPELKELYRLHDAEEKVAARAWLEYGHNYNQHAREFMYSWFAKHLQGKDEAVKEQPYTPTPVKELSVYDADHPRPADELNATKLREVMTKQSDEQLARLSPAEFRSVVGTAVRTMVGGGVPDEIDIVAGPIEMKLPDDVVMHKAAFRRKGGKEVVPAAGVFSKTAKGRGEMVLWVHPKGKSSLVEDGKLVPAAKALIEAGYAVVAMDTFATGEMARDKPLTVDRNFVGYTYGYNYPPLAERARDVLTMAAFARTIGKAKAVHVIGWESFGPVAVIAKAAAGDALGKVAADLNQFRFESIKATDDPMLLPGAVKYGGLPAFLALCAPAEVLAHNHRGTSSGKLSKSAYDAAGAKEKLTRVNEKLPPEKVAEWFDK